MLRLDRSKSFARIIVGDRSATLFWLLMLCLLTAVQLPGLTVNFASAATDWSQIDKVMMSDPSNNDEFGGSVALSADGNTLVATAPTHVIAGRSSGVLYVFVR